MAYSLTARDRREERRECDREKLDVSSAADGFAQGLFLSQPLNK